MADQALRSRITVEGGDQGAKELEKVVGATKKLGAATKETALASAQAAEESGKSAVTSTSAAGAAGALAVGVGKLALALRAVGKAFGAIPAIGSTLAVGSLIRRQLKSEISERLRLTDVIRRQGEALDELLGKQRNQKASLERTSDQRRFGGFDAETATRVANQAEQAKKAFPFLAKSDIDTAFGLFGDVGLSQRDVEDLAIAASAGRLDVDAQSLRSPRSTLRLGQRVLRRERRTGRNAQTVQRESTQGGGGRGGFRPDITEFEQDVRAEAASNQGPTGQLRSFLERLQSGGGIVADADLDVVQKLVRAFESSKKLRAANLAKTGLHPDVEIPISAFNDLVGQPTVDIPSLSPGGFVSDVFKGLGLGPTDNIPERDFREAIEVLKRIERFGTAGPSNVTINNMQGWRIGMNGSREQQRAITNGSNALASRELVGF